MTNHDLANLIIANQDRIESAIATGAAWEIWMQTELHIILRKANKQVAREVQYPAPNETKRLDLIAQDDKGIYAMELKVESANNAYGVLPYAQNDMVKIADFTVDSKAPTRWVIAIAYSHSSKQALNTYAGTQANKSIYNAGTNIGVMVTTV